MATQKTSSQLAIDLADWIVNELSKISPAPPEITALTHNTVLSELTIILDNVLVSYFNKVTGLNISDVSGLSLALAGKEDADPSLLRTTDVINNLISTAADKPLSALQGKTLKDLYDAIPSINSATILDQGGLNEVSALELRTHLDDTSIHFTEASIDHTNILNNGSYTHAQIDSHIADSTVHFTEASVDHNNILNVGSNTHVQIDAHISNTANPHDTGLAQVISSDGISLTKGNILVSNGSGYVVFPVGSDGMVIKADSSQPSGLNYTSDIGEVNTIVPVGTGSTLFVGKVGSNLNLRRINVTSTAITVVENGNTLEIGFVANNVNHQNLNGAGTNTHAQIDTHIADTTIHTTIDDLSTALTTVWSSTKTDSEITLAKSCDNHVDGATNAVYTLTERSKLSGISSGATANPIQAAITNLGAATTVGTNTGTSGAGLSLIGDTSTTDQSSNIMNDFKALQEDVETLNSNFNTLLSYLRLSNIITT